MHRLKIVFLETIDSKYLENNYANIKLIRSAHYHIDEPERACVCFHRMDFMHIQLNVGCLVTMEASQTQTKMVGDNLLGAT